MAQGFLVGLQRALLFFRDSNGYATGTQSTLSNGSTSSAYVFDYPITAGFNPPSSVYVDIEGGDKIVASIQFTNNKTTPFDMAIADFDTALVTMANGGATNTANSFHTYVSTNPARTTPRTFGLALQSRYELTNGLPYFLTTIFPQVSVSLKKSQRGLRAKSDVVLSCAPSFTTKLHDGRIFGSTGTGLNMQLEGDKTDNYDLISQYPIHITSFKSDAAATTFITPYRPVSTVVTVNASPNEMIKNGTATALTSIVTTTGVATLAAAGTAADMHVLTYETEYVPV
jgi:hypothetical protein